MKELKPFVDDPGKKGYKTGPVYYYEAKAGSILADHGHEIAETLWVLEGTGQVQIDEDIHQFEAPCEIHIPADVYHKFMPGTDVRFIELRHSAGMLKPAIP